MKPLLTLTLTLLLLITWATAIPSEMDQFQVTEERLYFPKLPEHSYIDRRLQDAQPSRGQEDREGHEQRQQAAKRELVMTATAYTQREEEGTADGITATGTKARPGVVATDPDTIPLGSWLYIESTFPGITGWYHAEDIGGGIKGARLDVFMEDLKTALRFGKREVRVRVK